MNHTYILPLILVAGPAFSQTGSGTCVQKLKGEPLICLDYISAPEQMLVAFKGACDAMTKVGKAGGIESEWKTTGGCPTSEVLGQCALAVAGMTQKQTFYKTKQMAEPKKEAEKLKATCAQSKGQWSDK